MSTLHTVSHETFQKINTNAWTNYKDYAEGGKISSITMKVHSFIGRLIRHIPDKYFLMIRYADLFAKRWKKQYVSRCRMALNQPEPDDTDANTHRYRSYAVLTSIPIFQCSNIPGSFDNPEAL